MNTSVSNILSIFDLASTEELAEGKLWYNEALRNCISIAAHFEVPVETVAGLVAALSPLREWERNLEDAIKALEYFQQHGTLATMTPQLHYSVLMGKAERILQGEDPLEVLRHSKRSGHKCHHFLRCIMSPDNDLHVTIDRWATRAALGKEPNRPAPTNRQYIDLVEAYYDAARQVDLKPCQLQAVVWLAIRRLDREVEDIPF